MLQSVWYNKRPCIEFYVFRQSTKGFLTKSTLIHRRMAHSYVMTHIHEYHIKL